MADPHNDKRRPTPLDIDSIHSHRLPAPFPAHIVQDQQPDNVEYSPTASSDTKTSTNVSPLSPTSPDFPSTPKNQLFSYPHIHSDTCPIHPPLVQLDDKQKPHLKQGDSSSSTASTLPIFDEPLLFPNKHNYDAVLGTGSFCRVVRAQSRTPSSKVYAVKVPFNRLEGTDSVENEARILAKLSHPGIIAFHGVYTNVPGCDGACGLVLDKYDGTILDYIDSLRTNPLANVDPTAPIVGHSLWIDWTRQLCNALAFVHASGYLHCDVKPDNVLIDSKQNVVLGDFASAKCVATYTTQPYRQQPHRQEYSILYAAPELLASTVDVPLCTYITDSYSLGLVLLVSATGNEPYSAAVKSPAQKLLWAQRGLPLQACTAEESMHVSLHDVKKILKTLLIDRETVSHLLTSCI